MKQEIIIHRWNTETKKFNYIGNLIVKDYRIASEITVLLTSSTSPYSTSTEKYNERVHIGKLCLKN